MFLYQKGFLPESFHTMFSTNKQVHSYNTRNKNSFRLPYCRTNIKKFTFRFQGPKLYNSLDDEIKNATSITSFLTKLKTFLLS